MSSGCGDVLSLEDLKTAKKNQVFEAEVITGRAGGVAGGVSIDFATNPNTGQVQKTMPAILRDIGFEPASFDFDTGGTIGVNERNVAVLWPLPAGDGDWYYWEGPLPKVIPASSTPATTGGVTNGAWRPLGDITLRGQLASSTGSQLIGVRQSNVYAELEVTPEMFGADPTGSASCDLAFQSALDYVASTKSKTLTLKGTYKLTGSAAILLANGVTIKGNRRGMTQGPQTVLGSLMTVTDEATIHVATPSGTTTPLFQAGRNCSFDGFSVVYINQPRSATLLSDLLVYGPTIKASHSCSVTNMRYVAAWDFFNATGEAHFLQNIYGYAFNVDYHIDTCADVSRFINIHINSNVYRPDWNVIDLAAPRSTSRAFELVQHDGMVFSDIHVFAKGTVFHNRQNSTARLCTLHGSLFSVDKCGTLLDSDVNGALCADLSNGEFIHDYHTNNGAVMNFSNPVASQVTNYFFNSWKFQLGSPGTSPGQGSWAPYLFNANSSTGARIWFHDINIPSIGTLELNNDLQSNRMEGSVTIGTRNINLRPDNLNLIPNSRLGSVNPYNNVPFGFSSLGSGVVVNGRNVTSTLPSSPTGLGLSRRVDASFASSCTAYVWASSKGDSSGILVTAYLSDFSDPIAFPSDGPAPFVRYGNFYLARVEIPSSAGRTHWDITANAPSSSGGILAVQSVNFLAGAPLQFSAESDEPPVSVNQIGAFKGAMNLLAGVGQQIPADVYPYDTGLVNIYIKTSGGMVGYQAYKNTTGVSGTVTATTPVGTITVTWPSGSGVRPTISSTIDRSITVAAVGI